MRKPEAITKVTRNFQISVPQEIRKALNLKIGDYIAFNKEEKKIFIWKVDFIESGEMELE